VPLPISSWCWGTRCGAPIARSTKVVVVARGTLLRADLEFGPTSAQLAIAGTPTLARIHGREVEWRATRPGGLTLRVAGPKGWVTYVGRLAIRG
jgi:hypothetical protein